MFLVLRTGLSWGSASAFGAEGSVFKGFAKSFKKNRPLRPLRSRKKVSKNIRQCVKKHWLRVRHLVVEVVEQPVAVPVEVVERQLKHHKYIISAF